MLRVRSFCRLSPPLGDCHPWPSLPAFVGLACNVLVVESPCLHFVAADASGTSDCARLRTGYCSDKGMSVAHSSPWFFAGVVLVPAVVFVLAPVCISLFPFSVLCKALVLCCILPLHEPVWGAPCSSQLGQRSKFQIQHWSLLSWLQHSSDDAWNHEGDESSG